jgi:hypothetical protein
MVISTCTGPQRVSMVSPLNVPLTFAAEPDPEDPEAWDPDPGEPPDGEPPAVPPVRGTAEATPLAVL